VTCHEDVARLAEQAIAKPLRRIVGLQIAGRGELRQRIARAPECFGGLTRTQLAAVPDDVGLRAARCCLGR